MVNEFLGLTKKQAQNKAEAKNFIFRLIRINNDNYMSYPDDVRQDRVCIEIDAGAVSKATIQ